MGNQGHSSQQIRMMYEWIRDVKNMRITNNAEADTYVNPPYRDGWTLYNSGFASESFNYGSLGFARSLRLGFGVAGIGLFEFLQYAQEHCGGLAVGLIKLCLP